jgi:DNA-directed RNA polymerase specialized sigma subunit
MDENKDKLIEDLLDMVWHKTDRWIFRILLLAITMTLLVNAYANWGIKASQQEATYAVQRMEVAIHNIPDNTKLQQSMEQLVNITHRIQKKLRVPDE